MENKKMTKKEMFKELLAIVGDNEDMVNFINHEIELLDKKASSSKLTKTQVENENIKTQILNKMVELARPVQISDLVVAFDNEFTNQKISALVKQLVDNGKVSRQEDKKKAYFTIA